MDLEQQVGPEIEHRNIVGEPFHSHRDIVSAPVTSWKHDR